MLAFQIFNKSLTKKVVKKCVECTKKGAFNILKQNNGLDQLRCNRAADKRLFFCYIDNTIPLLLKS